MINHVYSFDEFSIPLGIKVLFWCLYMVVFGYTVWNTLIATPKSKSNAKSKNQCGNKSSIITPKKGKGKRHFNISSLILPFFIVYTLFFCINPDYFSYRDWMDKPLFMDWDREQFYFYLILFCRWLPINYPFELFRLIIWGGALLLVLYTARMYRKLLMPVLVLIFLFVFFSDRFCYARASLAMAVFFTGVSIFFWGKKRWVKMCGLVLAICSYFFHHELIVGIGLLPSILFPFEKKETIYYSLILLAIAIAAITYINSNLGLMESVFGNDDMAQKIDHFNNREQAVFRVSTFVVYLNIFYPFALITRFFYQKKHLPKPIIGIYRITFAIILVSIAFFIVSGPRSVYTYRVLWIAIIPVSILIAYCYKKKGFKSYEIAIMLFLALLSNSVRIINAI